MDDVALAGQFEANRPRLRAVALRMLGSTGEADDAVQEAWLRLSRAGGDVDNLSAWLTTVVGRVCLDMLRQRTARREDEYASADQPAAEPDPEQQALLADSVGLALLVVLETLSPAERLAFVLHDLFGVPFDEIAPILDRSPAATRQLASRARRRARLASCRAATGVRSIIGAISSNVTPNMSCSTNASRSAGARVSSTTNRASPTEVASRASCSGSIPFS